MNKKYDTLVYIGRFNPLHSSHLAVIRKALLLADKVLVIIGSANTPRTFKNPFTFSERSDMIRLSLGRDIDAYNRTTIVPIEDNLYNDQLWLVQVLKEIDNVAGNNVSVPGKVGIIGHLKDESSYYIKMFPKFEFVDVGYIDQLDATEIRNIYFNPKQNLNFLLGVVPNNVLAFLTEFKKTEAYAQIVKEKEFIEKYKKQYEQLPYPPTFVTVDACVIQSGYVLLVKRRSEPGKGLLALPGGFLDAKSDKSLEDAMIRELNEETGIKVPEKVLRGNIKKMHVFDAIERSSRGRTITNAFKIVLPEGEWSLPKLRAGDDAEKAEWHAISSLKRKELFEDHFDILKFFLGEMA